MKKVVVINSTPRVNGNSEVLAKEFARGAMDAGHEVEIINLREHNLNYCIGCYACHSTGKCFHKDKMPQSSRSVKSTFAPRLPLHPPTIRSMPSSLWSMSLPKERFTEVL